MSAENYKRIIRRQAGKKRLVLNQAQRDAREHARLAAIEDDHYAEMGLQALGDLAPEGWIDAAVPFTDMVLGRPSQPQTICTTDSELDAAVARGDYVVKDSGARQSFASGMVRDTEEGKTDYTSLVEVEPLLTRLCQHLHKGAVKYGRGNWQHADSAEERDRFKRSAARHMRAYLLGETDEDHAAAVVFNLNAAEAVPGKLDAL